MRALMADVEAFHLKCGQPVADKPGSLTQDRLYLRRSLHAEEWRELDNAIVAGDLVLTADGIADLIYVLVGTALELGIPLDRVWAEVQAANLRKADGPKREDGKQMKPEGWQPPDIHSAIWGAK